VISGWAGGEENLEHEFPCDGKGGTTRPDEVGFAQVRHAAIEGAGGRRESAGGRRPVQEKAPRRGGRGAEGLSDPLSRIR